MMLGMLLAIVLYRPIFKEFVKDTNAKEWVKQDLIKIKADTITKSENNLQLQQISTQYKNYYGAKFTMVETDTLISKLTGLLKKDTHPKYQNINVGLEKYIKFVFLVFLLIFFVTMVYGPIAAFLVELFPTKIRYTSMSLPYHIGNGVFGGLTPFIATLFTTIYTADKLVGLWYPIIVAAICMVIGVLYISNKIDPEINE